MKHRSMVIAGLLVSIFVVLVATTHGQDKPVAPVATLPGVWKLTKVTINTGEGESAIFEHDKGEYSTTGHGLDQMYKLRVSYSWYIPKIIVPSRAFQTTLNVAFGYGFKDNKKQDTTRFESYLAIGKNKYQVQPKEKYPKHTKAGSFGYRLPFEGVITDTWKPAEKYGQTGPAISVEVCLSEDLVTWFKYYYTYTEAPVPPDPEDPAENINDQKDDSVLLKLMYPAGRSPKVFNIGWVFGAKCLVK